MRVAGLEQKLGVLRTAAMARQDNGVQQLWHEWQKVEAPLLGSLAATKEELRAHTEHHSTSRRLLQLSQAKQRFKRLARSALPACLPARPPIFSPGCAAACEVLTAQSGRWVA
jgi:hypothetical protein